MIVATFPGRVVPPEIYMALKFGTGFLGVNLRARELGGGVLRITGMAAMIEGFFGINNVR